MLVPCMRIRMEEGRYTRSRQITRFLSGPQLHSLRLNAAPVTKQHPSKEKVAPSTVTASFETNPVDARSGITRVIVEHAPLLSN